MIIEKGKSAVYTLSDPKTSRIFYVGQTKNPKKRLIGHLKSPTNNKMALKIKELKDKKLKPVMNIIEVCDSNNAINRENYWIDHYSGLRLFNGCFVDGNPFSEIKKHWILKLKLNESLIYSYRNEDILKAKETILNLDSNKLFFCLVSYKDLTITTKLISNTIQMENLIIGGAFETDVRNYGTMRSMRSVLRKKGFDFQFKLGKGILTVRRTQ